MKGCLTDKRDGAIGSGLKKRPRLLGRHSNPVSFRWSSGQFCPTSQVPRIVFPQRVEIPAHRAATATASVVGIVLCWRRLIRQASHARCLT